MPTVPIYRSQVQTERAPDTRLGQRTTAADMGGNIAEGVQALGRGIAQASASMDEIAAKERRRVQQIAIDDAKLKMESTLSPKLAKARTTRGKDAIGVAESLLPEYDTLAEDVGKGLGTQELRDAFKAYTIDRRISVQRELDNHAAQGMQEYDDEVFTANGKILSNRLAGGYKDPALVAIAVSDRLKEVGAYADRNGKSDEWRKSAIAQTQSAAARQVITAHADDGNDLAAKKWLEAYDRYLTAEDKLAVSRLVERTSTANEGLRQGQRIYDPAQSLEAAFTKADQIEDPGVRAEAKRWLSEKHTMAERAKEATQDREFEAIYKEAAKSPLGLRAIPPSRLEALDADKRERLESALRRETAGVKLAWQESKAKRYEIEAMLADPNKRTEILRRGPGIFLGLMNEDDQNSIASTIKELRDAKTADRSSWLNSREDRINQALVSLNMDPRPFRTDGGKAVANPPAVAFRAAVEDEANRLARDGKRDTPTGDDVQKAIDTVLTRKVMIEKWGTDPERVAATLTPDERAKAYVPIDQIPGNYRADLAAEIERATGKPAEDDRVQRAYAAALSGDRALYDRIIAGD